MPWARRNLTRGLSPSRSGWHIPNIVNILTSPGAHAESWDPDGFWIWKTSWRGDEEGNCGWQISFFFSFLQFSCYLLKITCPCLMIVQIAYYVPCGQGMKCFAKGPSLVDNSHPWGKFLPCRAANQISSSHNILKAPQIQHVLHKAHDFLAPAWFFRSIHSLDRWHQPSSCICQNLKRQTELFFSPWFPSFWIILEIVGNMLNTGSTRTSTHQDRCQL